MQQAKHLTADFQHQLLTAILADVKATFPEDDFVSGTCHNLAMGLAQGLAQCQVQAKLIYAIRSEIDEETNDVFLTCYSHMVCELDIDQSDWDIDGIQAADRWMGSWDDSFTPGFYSAFKWETLNGEAIPAFKEKYRVTPHEDRIAQISKIVADRFTTLMH